MSTIPFYNLDLFTRIYYLSSLMINKIPYIFFLLLLFCAFTVIFDSPGMAWDKAWPVQPTTTSEKEKEVGNPGSWVISIYQDLISPVDGDRCPSEPSCSTYSRKAIRKHGFFIGWMMTVDRLIHEFSEAGKTSPIVFTKGKWKIHDPVENNDFWWFPRDGKPHD